MSTNCYEPTQFTLGEAALTPNLLQECTAHLEPVQMLRVFYLTAGLVLAALFSWGLETTTVSAQRAPAPSELGGQVYRDGCSACHGVAGQGVEALAAPALAGQDPNYLENQLASFAMRRRGGGENDRYGSQMTLFAQLLGQADRQAVARYLSSLTPTRPVATLDGDLAHGRDLYAPCAACHGERGEGGPAPRLAGLGDWYIATQMRLYATGARGYDDNDPDGQNMAAIAANISEEEVRDLAAYINSLGGPRRQ